MSDAALNRPIWSALTTRHAGLAEGGALARRYPAAIGPFGAMADDSDAARAAMRDLVRDTGPVACFTPEPLEAPEGLAIVTRGTLQQMVGAVVPLPGAPTPQPLDESDLPAMLALATLTKPGPFTDQVLRLGAFVGVRDGGVLVAMAGQRMALDGHTEMTAVCTHAEHRGRGLGRAVLAAVSASIVAEGRTPFLHVMADNAAAIALYRQCGMAMRATLHLTVLRP